MVVKHQDVTGELLKFTPARNQFHHDKKYKSIKKGPSPQPG